MITQIGDNVTTTEGTGVVTYIDAHGWIHVKTDEGEEIKVYPPISIAPRAESDLGG